VKKTQKYEKTAYDRTVCPKLIGRDRVFLLEPSEKTGEARNLSRPYHGPYQVIEVHEYAHVRRVDTPQEEPILVAIQRLKQCPLEIPDEFWPPEKRAKRSKS